MSEMIRTVSRARFTPARLGRLAMFAVFALVSACSGSGSDAIDPLGSASFDHKPGHVNAGGGSGGSGGSTADATSFAQPELTVTVDGNVVTVSWPGITGAEQYQVRSPGTGLHTPSTAATSVTATVPNGTYTVTARVKTVANANNESGWSSEKEFTVAVPTVVTTPSDTTPPVITFEIDGTEGLGGWYTSNVFVDWTVADAQSAISSTTTCDDFPIIVDQHAITYTCTATSAGGTASKSVTIKRDATTPSVAANLPVIDGNNGWYVSNVPVSFTVSHSGPSGHTVSAECAPYTVMNDGPFSSTCTATSGAGLWSSATASGRKDSTIPFIGYSAHPSAYTVDQTVSITCSASDAMSGIATNTCAPISGDAHTFNIGTNAFSASATDNAGNGNSATTGFTVSVTSESLCNLTRRFVAHAGIANSLCVKLNAAAAAAARGNLAGKAGPLNAYVKEVQAQTGKAISTANAAILIRLAGLL